MSDTPTKTNRPLDVAPSASFGEFMSSGWTPSNLQGLTPSPAAPWCVERRKALSMAFLGVRVILPAGNFKVRSNDSDFRYRPHSAFAYYAGVQGAEATADAVFILEPTNQGHDALLFINPRSTRDTEDFYRNSKYGELWVGRRFTTDEAQQRWQIETRKVESLKEFLADGKESILLRGQDAAMDALVKVSAREDELAMFVSAARLIKDAYEVEEMQKACDSTARGFADVVRAFPAAISTPRGERVIEAAFFGRARVEGNDIGYDTIAASGAHACVLHWNRNDGDVRLGELLLLDAGVERESYYTADVTRTLPISGKFTPAQRSLYMLVLEAQKAGFAAVKPGAKFADINVACQTVLAHGLADMGVLQLAPRSLYTLIVDFISAGLCME
ncbi:MAG: aminopeptidase P N-terminal domain-containing protein [Actinomycetota bacterium]